MTQYGPLISYDVSSVPVRMTVAYSISERVNRIFRENYRLPINTVVEQGDQLKFEFEESVDPDTFLRHLRTGSPEDYGSV